MATIDELKGLASTRLGFARPNYFMVELGRGGLTAGNLLGGLVPSIPGLIGDNNPNSRELSTLCNAAQLPGKQVLTMPVTRGIVQQKVAHGYAVGDVTLSFHLLNDYGVKNYFDEWYSTIIDANKDVNYKNTYVRPVKIHQLRKPIFGKTATFGPLSANLELGGGSVYTVELKDAFPTTFSDIELTDDGENGIMKFSVQISYTDWETKRPSILSNIAGGINLGGTL